MTRITALLTLTSVAGLAAADVVASYSYTDLDGSYDGQTFTADAANNTDLTSGGDVSLLTGAKGTAEFDTGFLGSGAANVQISMTLSNVTGSSADGTGSVTLTDLDGDTLTAAFDGTWSILNPIGFMFFSGSSSDYSFTDNGDSDGRFNGTTGSFSLSGLTTPLFDGAISLLLQRPGGFGSSFDSESTQADGILIPTPGALAIAGVGVLGMLGRRRG